MAGKNLKRGWRTQLRSGGDRRWIPTAREEIPLAVEKNREYTIDIHFLTTVRDKDICYRRKKLLPQPPVAEVSTIVDSM